MATDRITSLYVAEALDGSSAKTPTNAPHACLLTCC